ncbi:MAG: protein kinase [Candidatus Anammoximicrobium sp.]|nr:protein kinase [Candidatus Anammoximicrobium sp.]
MTASLDALVELSEADRRRLEFFLFDFDRAWSPHGLAACAKELPPDDRVYRQAALVELVKIDLERQWQSGSRCTLEDYLRQFPELGSRETVSTEILQAEYEARLRFGTPDEVEDFQRRFPNFSSVSEPVPQLSTAPNVVGTPAEASVDTSREGRDADTGVPIPGQLTALPEQFGRYRILKRLSSGGMGTVYLAHDGELDRKVALKVPKSDQAGDREWIRRFYQEARAAAALHHRNICSIFDIGEVDGMHYISMAWIEGESLSDWIRSKRPISQRDAAAIVYKLALALQEAHARGVIHRDLKPANVMMDREQEPVITDFGLARQLDRPEQSRLTHPGMIMGTPAYMSPEQISGEIERVQTPSDIYSLGVILYELLTGELPFSGTVSVVIGKKLSQDAPRSASLRGNVAPLLDSICAKMLNRRIEDRYQSMRQVADDLRRYLDREEILDSGRLLAWGNRAALRLRRLVGAARRYPQQTIAVLAGALAVLAAVMVLRTPYGTLQIETDDPNLRVLLDGRQLRIENIEAPHRVRAGEHEFKVLLGNQTIPVDMPIELNHEEYRGQYTLAAELDATVLLSNRFTVLRNKERVLTIRLVPQLLPPKPLPIGPRSAVSGCFVFSAFDGRQWDLYTYTPTTDSLANVTGTRDGNEFYPRFSPDGRSIAFQSNQHGFGLEDRAYDVYVLESSGCRRLTTEIGWAGSGVAWSSDGTELLASVEQWKDGDPFPPWTNWQEIWRIPLTGGKPALVPNSSQPKTFYITPDWHRSSGVVLAKYDAPFVYQDLFVAQLERNQTEKQLTDTRSRKVGNIEPRWSPDGQRIWFASERNSRGIFRLYVVGADGTSLEPKLHDAAEDRSPVPIENGIRVAFIRHPATDPRLMIASTETTAAETLKDLSSLSVKEVRSLDWTASDGFARGSPGSP